jgi:hypothetical protein
MKKIISAIKTYWWTLAIGSIAFADAIDLGGDLDPGMSTAFGWLNWSLGTIGIVLGTLVIVGALIRFGIDMYKGNPDAVSRLLLAVMGGIVILGGIFLATKIVGAVSKAMQGQKLFS